MSSQAEQDQSWPHDYFDPMNLPKTSDSFDVPPWRPQHLHIGLGLRFTEPDGSTAAAEIGYELKPGDTLDKTLQRLLREAFAHARDFGFKREKSYTEK